MTRRDVMASSAVAVFAAAEATAGGTAPNEYFLSQQNPIANRDQREAEALAIRLFSRPDVRTAIDRGAAAWRQVTSATYSAEQLARFDDHIADFSFRGCLVAAASDSNYPKIVRVYAPAAKWMGNDTPASKWGGDNPDNAYRIMPIEPGGRYEVHGQRQPNASSYVTYQIVGNTTTSLTLASLEQRDVEIASNGSYVLTLDDSPAAGRRNHLQIPPRAMFLFIRDSMGDWKQAPDALRPYRLNPPTRAPLSDDEFAARAISNILTDVYYAYYAIRLFMNTTPQSMTLPRSAGAGGGLITQVVSLGHFSLRDDEAIIITVTTADAAYCSFVVHDMWLRALEYRNHQTSLNNAQMMANGDGRVTYVMSLRDPGIHNWLDLSGVHDVLVCQRWQGLPAQLRQQPTIEIRRVKFSDLASAIPADVRRVTAAERVQQLRERQRDYDRRFSES